MVFESTFPHEASGQTAVVPRFDWKLFLIRTQRSWSTSGSFSLQYLQGWKQEKNPKDETSQPLSWSDRKKKKKKKTRRIQIWRTKTDFWRIFWGGKKSSNKKSLSGQRRYSTWAPYGGVKRLTRWQWADGWHVDAKRFGEKVRQIYGHIMLSHSCSQMWWKKMCEHIGGTARSMQNSQDNLYGSHHVQVLLKMQQTLSNFGWLLCGFLFWTKQTTKQQNKHCRAVSPKFVIHFWKQFWLLKISTWKVPLSIGGSTPHQHLALMSESKYRGGLTWMR